ncbi:MAG: NAD(P)/FAD-dependent oxidoreductase, partial [Desulfobacterales bacterium]|nr:NAD(P)/FAD-dependent oxidoreductase [Desulfobacterales bacterium]
MANQTRITVIGGGVGGYPAAIKAARLGASVTLIEKDVLGGTCLNRGCIPTKSLLQAGEVVETIKNAERFGVECEGFSVDFKAVSRRKNAVVKQLRKGVETLLKRRRIKVVKGSAELLDASAVQIKETGEKIASDRIIIAAGSRPAPLSLDGLNGPGVLDSDGALRMKRLPESVAIIGGGVIGVEFAQIFKRLGSEVAILEAAARLAPGMDEEIAAALEKRISDDGVKVFTRVEAKKIVHQKGINTISYLHDGKKRSISVEKIILAVGRKPALADLKADRIGLAHENGFLNVNDRMETNIPHIYGAGDVVGGVMLAHKATAEGECAAANALGRSMKMSYKVIPSCVYTSPEAASVGLTEEEAKKRHDIE